MFDLRNKSKKKLLSQLLRMQLMIKLGYEKRNFCCCYLFPTDWMDTDMSDHVN